MRMRETTSRALSARWMTVAFAAVFLLACLPCVLADEQAEIDREIRFASALVEARFPDYAKKVVEKLLVKYPQAKAAASKVGIEILFSTGKFEEAEKQVNSMPPGNPETAVMLLTLGDQFYARGKMKDAKRVYEAFFKQFPGKVPPEIERFYGESAYKFAQMMIFYGDEEAAIEAYRNVLKTKLENDVLRRVKTELAEILVRVGSKLPKDKRKPYFDEAKKICMDIQWGGLDPWFAKTAVIYAHILMIEGDKAGARKTVTDYLPMLQQVDEILKEAKEPPRLSPMAECRYLLGILYADEGDSLAAQKDKQSERIKAYSNALQHLYTVAIKYPGSSWAPDARRRAEAVTQILEEELGKTVTRPKMDDAQLVSEQLKEARVLMQQQDFKAAAEKYLEILSISQDFSGVMGAFGDLAKCYAEQGDRVYADAVTGFIAERFCESTNRYDEAGAALLKVASAYEERNDMLMASRVWGLYASQYPRHAAVADVLFRQGDLSLRSSNYVAAVAFYKQIMDNYPKSRMHQEAIGRTAFCYAMLGDHTNAIAAYSNYVAVLPSTPEVITVRLKLADEYRLAKQLAAAINEYARLIASVTQEPAKYGGSPEDLARNRKSLEFALYFKAQCYAQLQQPQDQIPVFQAKAVEGYGELLKQFPKSDLAPSALSAMGTLCYLLKRPQEAGSAFDRLVKEFPESPQAKDILFVQGQSLIDMGRNEDAIRVFADMFKNPKSFKPSQFLRVGRVMMDAKEYDTAAKAFGETRNVAASTNALDVAMWQEASVGLSRALMAQAVNEDAAKPLEELTRKYPRTAYLIEANFMLAQIYAELGTKTTDKDASAAWFAKAIKAMTTVSKYAATGDVVARKEVELGAIHYKMGNKDSALADYERVILTMDITKAAMLPYYEKALEGSIPLLADKGRHRDVLDNCETYLRLYPAGRLEAWARQWRDTARKMMAGQGSPR